MIIMLTFHYYIIAYITNNFSLLMFDLSNWIQLLKVNILGLEAVFSLLCDEYGIFYISKKHVYRSSMHSDGKKCNYLIRARWQFTRLQHSRDVRLVSNVITKNQVYP